MPTFREIAGRAFPLRPFTAATPVSSEQIAHVIDAVEIDGVVFRSPDGFTPIVLNLVGEARLLLVRNSGGNR